MRRFRCLICGYIHDEAEGLPERGIAPGMKWEDIPSDYTCPRCGAPKTVFEEIGEEKTVPVNAAAIEPEENEPAEDLRELSAGELSALFSNLAKGCEKQRLDEETNLFNQLSDYYKARTVPRGEGLEDISSLLKADLSEGFARANAVSSAKTDRGALRSLVWSEKVSRMISSLLSRYSEEGDAMLENTKIYVCDICGFVYAGNNLPEVCPVCKVPNFKISQIGRR